MIKKMSAKLRKQVSKEVYPILKQSFFKDGVPLAELFLALSRCDVVALQEDNTEWSGMLCGSEGRALITLASKQSGVDNGGYMIYTPFENAGLCLSWYWMEGVSGKRCEVVGYIS